MKKASKRDGVQERNLMRLKLLFLIEQFQKDVKKIRIDFDIPENGYSEEEKEKCCKNEESLELFYRRFPFFDQFDKNGSDFQIRVKNLATKYKLPDNYANTICCGLPEFILFNKLIAPDSNWVLEILYEYDESFIDSVAIKAYTILTKKEVAEAVSELKWATKKFMNPSIVKLKRNSACFDRDIKILATYLNIQFNKPKIDKVYNSIYAEILKKQGKLKDLREWERCNKDYIEVRQHDKKTSRDIAKESGVSIETVKQVKMRLNVLAKKWFGVGFD